MRNLIIGALGALVLSLGLTALAQTKAESPSLDVGHRLTEAAKRPCVHPDGGWTTIATDNTSSTSSAQLNAWSMYYVQCEDDTYACWGEAACTADTSDGWIPSGTWYPFLTTAGLGRYVGLRNKNVDSTCRIMECL